MKRKQFTEEQIASVISELLGNAALQKLRELAQLEQRLRLTKMRTLQRAVEQFGLRGAARLHRLDPSNLRRRIGGSVADRLKG